MSCVVVFRQPDRIVMAGDSICKRVHRDSMVETSHIEPGRKVRRYGRWTLAGCGGSEVPLGTGTLDVLDEFGSAVEHAPTIDVAIRRMAERMGSRIVHGYQQASRYPLFDELFPAGPDGQELVSVYVGGTHPDGTLVLGNFQAFLMDKRAFTVQMRGGSVPGPAHDGTALFCEAQGQRFAIDSLRRRPLPDWLARGDAEAARRLLYEQLDTTPDNIAAPMHIVEITREGRTEVLA
jgi:hypothetical protein